MEACSLSSVGSTAGLYADNNTKQSFFFISGSLQKNGCTCQHGSAVVLRKILHLLVQSDPTQLAVTVDVGGWCDYCWIVKGADSNHAMPRITFVAVENRRSAMAAEMFCHTLSEMKG